MIVVAYIDHALLLPFFIRSCGIYRTAQRLAVTLKRAYRSLKPRRSDVSSIEGSTWDRVPSWALGDAWQHWLRL
jgi:hypothetical protein